MDMTSYSPYLQYLDDESRKLNRLLKTWANINTGSRNIAGLDKFLSLLEKSFRKLSRITEIIPLPAQTILRPEGEVSLPLGKAFSIRKRPNAPVRVLLTIHYDTVYAADHPFQKCGMVDHHSMKGPGVADAKGGLIVLFKALEAFERSPWADRLGWEVLLGPDEEIGSIGTTPLLLEAAGRNDLALVFEPALPDRTLISTRNGSSVYSGVVKGRAAHPGREPELGRSAIHALANFIVQMLGAFEAHKGITINVGEVTGGGAVNVVTDLAYCRFNIRTHTSGDEHTVDTLVKVLERRVNESEGIQMELRVDSSRSPKTIDDKTNELLHHIASCGHDLGMQIQWGHSGGASDANILAAAGIPTVDGLGVTGGGLHSPDEFILLDSIVERAKLTALLLMKLASGDIRWSRHGH